MKRFEKLFFQGDVAILKLPKGYELTEGKREIAPTAGRLILQEGEITGHHHAIDLATRPKDTYAKVAMEDFDDLIAKDIKPATAKMFRDEKLVEKLRQDGLLTVTNLAVGFLLVEGGPMDVTHEEHSAIKVPPGLYYVGAQRQWDSEQERRVAD